MSLPDPLWGEVLQRANVNNDFGGPARRRGIWETRQTEMGTAQSTARQQYAAALAAQNAKELADLAAADALKAQGRGGGGRGGSGGGSSGSAAYQPLPDMTSDWYDQYANYQPSQAPSFDMPSTKFGIQNVYKKVLPKVKPSADALRTGHPHPRIGPKPTRYASRLS